MSKKTTTFGILGLGITLATGTFVAPAAAAAAGAPCSGVWKLNEQMTHRTRSPIGPIYQFFEPWGKDGWMRMNTQDLSAPVKGAEWHFEQFNGRPYQVFGGDPSLQHSRKITDHIIETIRVRDRQESDYSQVIFSQDCKRVTYYFPEGDDRHGEPGKQHYYNDVRVFDLIEAPAGASTVADVFGGWELNRGASKLTMAPMNAETVVIVPWGKNGWIWNQISGGPYQPEDLHKGVSRVECGATQGPTARACQGPPSSMVLYWASWDAKTYATYGSAPHQVQLKRDNDRTFEVTYFKAPQAAAQGSMANVSFSPDGQHLTVTMKAGAGAADDVRVYDRINADNWPTVAP